MIPAELFFVFAAIALIGIYYELRQQTGILQRMEQTQKDRGDQS